MNIGFWSCIILVIPFVSLVCLWNGYVADNSNIHAFSNWKK